MRLLIACASLTIALSGCGRDEFRIGWSAAEDRSLELTYSTAIGPELDDVDVEEHEDRVVVTLGDDCFVSCDADDAEVFHCVRVTLDEPLGSRQVIDGSTGRPPESRPPGRPRPDVPCEPPP
jgi:hypothetical protein